MIFDTDSIPILIDSGASYCMTFDERDFINDPVPINTGIQGLGDSIATKWETIHYSLSDDSSCITHFLIKDCYLVPMLPIRIFSPQHWFDEHPDWSIHHNLKCVHGHVHVVLEWDGTTHHVPKNAANIFVMHSPPSYSTSDKVLQGLSAMLPDVPSCFPVHIIPLDNDTDYASQPASPSASLPFHVLCLTKGSDPSSLDHPM